MITVLTYRTDELYGITAVAQGDGELGHQSQQRGDQVYLQLLLPLNKAFSFARLQHTL